jgi:hypothetical protein
VQSRGLSRRGLRINPPQSKDQDGMDGDPFHRHSVVLWMDGLSEPVGRKFLSGTSVLGFFH